MKKIISNIRYIDKVILISFIMTVMNVSGCVCSSRGKTFAGDECDLISNNIKELSTVDFKEYQKQSSKYNLPLVPVDLPDSTQTALLNQIKGYDNEVAEIMADKDDSYSYIEFFNIGYNNPLILVKFNIPIGTFSYVAYEKPDELQFYPQKLESLNIAFSTDGKIACSKDYVDEYCTSIDLYQIIDGQADDSDFRLSQIGRCHRLPWHTPYDDYGPKRGSFFWHKDGLIIECSILENYTDIPKYYKIKTTED